MRRHPTNRYARRLRDARITIAIAGAIPPAAVGLGLLVVAMAWVQLWDRSASGGK